MHNNISSGVGAGCLRSRINMKFEDARLTRANIIAWFALVK